MTARAPAPPLDPDDAPLIKPPGRPFVGHMSIYLTASALNAAIPFILLPILTRVFTPSDYGIVAMFTVAVSIFAAFTGLSVHGAVGVRYFKMDRGQFANFVAACLALVAGLTFLALIVILLAGRQLEGFSGVPRDWLLAAALVSALQTVGLVKLTIWQVRGKAIRYAVFQVLQTLLNLGASLMLVLVVGLGWEGRLAGQLIAVGLFAAIAILCLARAGEIRGLHEFGNHARAALRFGVPVIPHVLGGLMIASIDRVIIAGSLGLAAAGIYLVGLQIAMAIGLLADAFNKVFSPWLMSELAKSGQVPERRIVRGTYIYFVAILGIAAMLGALAPTIVAIVAGEAFQQASSVIFWLALGSAFGGCYLMVTNYIFYAERTEYLAAITISCGLLNIPMTYWLVQLNGMVGAAQAFALTQLLFFLATWILAQKVRPMPWLKALRH